MYTYFDTMRDLERTPLLSQDVVVLSEKVKSYIRRLARELAPRVSTIEKRWQRRLPAIFGKSVNGSHLRALASINPGNWLDMLAEGRMSEFLEQVEYHGRRLAKLDVPPNHVLASLQQYEEALLPDLKKSFPRNFRSYIAALDHLYFCVKLTLNNAYYQVRDLGVCPTEIRRGGSAGARLDSCGHQRECRVAIRLSPFASPSASPRGLDGGSQSGFFTLSLGLGRRRNRLHRGHPP